MPCEDMRLIASAVRLSTQTGGSLVDVMEQLVDTIRNRTEFQQKLKTLTAQGKFEALAMASAPMVAFLLLYACQPDLMQPLVTTTTGWIAIGVALALEIVGFVVIKKIVTIEV
jgi:tight adherence protein B